VEIVISYFIYDTHTLLACSMTCYSWYIAAVPHLHHSLTTDNRSYSWGKDYRWSKPIHKSYKLGLLPLVKRLRIRQYPILPLHSEWLGKRTLRYFSAFTNLQELGIDNLQVSTFMPDIQRYFGHFAPTLRFLALRNRGALPERSCTLSDCSRISKTSRSATTSPQMKRRAQLILDLFPPPYLRWCGRLTLRCFKREALVKDMIAVFGGIRFVIWTSTG
jgi:hypothetical protein